MQSLSLRAKFTFLSLAVLIAVSLLAYTGYSAVGRLLELSKLETVNQVVRNAMELDMMHDAIHGDVQGSVSALHSKEFEAIEAAKATLKDHMDTSEKDLNTMAGLELSDEVSASVKAVKPDFEAYAQQAETLLNVLSQDAMHGTEKYIPLNKEFEETFEAMEKKLGKNGDTVEEWAKQIKEAGLKTADEERRNLTVILVIAIALSVFLPVYARLSLFHSLGKLVAVSDSLSQEEYEIQVPYTHRHDEIGRLANSLESLRVKAADAFRLKTMVDDMPLNIMTADAHNEFRINYANKASKQTLRSLQQYLPVKIEDIEGTSIDIFHKDPMRIRTLLADPKNLPHNAKIKIGPEVIDQKVSAVFNKKGEYVGPMLAWSIVTQNVKLADDFETSIGAVSGQLSANAHSLEERATTLQSSIEELSTSALEISKRVHESLNIVKDAVQKGSDATQHTEALTASAGKVASVVTLIRTIAEKTNLLALNATIESARAGEAGKGFAVVANEVKLLATQTGSAINEITAQIHEMQSSALGTTDAIKQMCNVVMNINHISTEIASTVEEQQAATSEIVRNISGSSSEMGNPSSMTVLGMSAQLTEASNHLQTQCSNFLEKVRKL